MEENHRKVEPLLDAAKRLMTTLAVVVVVVFLLVLVLYILDFGEKVALEWIKAVAALATPLAISVGLWFTRGALIEQRKATQNATEQLKLDSRTKVAELYNRTASQLGSDKSESERIAALYMMEAISQQYPEYYHQCIKVICSFARDVTRRELDSQRRARSLEIRYAPAEIRTVTEILSRRKHRYLDGESEPLNLDFIDFSWIKFEHADFEGATFRVSVFHGTVFQDSSFANCDFEGAVFKDCRAVRTYFNGAQNMQLEEGSLSIEGGWFIDNPTKAVRGEFPNHFGLLPVRTREQPYRVPSALSIAGTGFNTTKELRPLMLDWGKWLRFLEDQVQESSDGWWWETDPTRWDEFTEAWSTFSDTRRDVRETIDTSENRETEGTFDSEMLDK